jgi:metal-responsive CopG/Arc/MetJ family transcriptional regulator
VKTAISLPDDTFERVENAARRLGVSRSQFFARAAERWLDALDDESTTDAINRAIEGVAVDTSLTDVAAGRLVLSDEQ